MLAATVLAGIPARAPHAQPTRKFRIGFLAIESPEHFIGGERERFLAALAGLGYVVGRNLEVEERYPKDPGQATRSAAELAALALDAIVTESTPTTLALQKATRSIPIVTHVGDPVVAGFAQTLQRPGGNITGLSQSRVASFRKEIELVRVLRPAARTVAIVYEAPYPGAEILMRPIVEAAREASLSVYETSYRKGEFDRVLDDLRGRRIDTMVHPGVPESVAVAALRARVAVFASGGQEVESGALASVENDGSEDYQRMAVIVAKILKGARPGEIPFEEPTRFRIVMNARTAAALAIRIPPEVLLRVDRMIQ